MENPDLIIANYLAGECQEPEVQRLHTWRQQKAEHEIYFQKLQVLWQEGKILTDTFNPNVALAQQAIHDKIASELSGKLNGGETSRDPLYYVKRIAAAIIISLGAALGYYFSVNPVHDLITIETLLSEKKEIVLADGSSVWLNENSNLRFPEKFTDDHREVYLTGEAYFEVTKNPDKPFIIHSQQSLTQVIGTSFNVRSVPEEEKTIVTVTSGKVSFYRESQRDGKIFLMKGDRGILDNGSTIAFRETNDDLNFMSWKTGKIVFNDTSFEEVAETLSRHYHKKIMIQKTLSNCRLTSTFENQTLEEILNELALLRNITIEKNSNGIQLAGRGC